MTRDLAQVGEQTEGRAPGRPRSIEVDRAILDATRNLLADYGPAGMSIEAVATRAGVGKATIYRRWSGKDDLLVDALRSLNDDLPPIPVGSPLRDTLLMMLKALQHKGQGALTSRIMPHLIGCRDSDPEYLEAYLDVVIEPRRERYRTVLRAAVASGELVADTDVDLATTMLVGPLLYSEYVRRPSQQSNPDLADQVVDAVLRAFGPAPQR